jgi:hypothetical protein
MVLRLAEQKYQEALDKRPNSPVLPVLTVVCTLTLKF